MANRTPTPSLQELQQRSTDLSNRINTVNAGLLGQTEVGVAGYFAANPNEQKLAIQQDIDYTTEYNKLYNANKNVNFTIDKTADQANTNALYVFDAAQETERALNAKIEGVKNNNLAYETQQKRIADFTATKAQAETQNVLASYLNTAIQNNKGLSTGYVYSSDTDFSMDTWKNTKPKNRTLTYQTVTDSKGRKTTVPVHSYKISDEENEKRMSIFKEMETNRFFSDTALQTRQAETYKASLTNELKTTNIAVAKSTFNSTVADLRTAAKEAIKTAPNNAAAKLINKELKADIKAAKKERKNAISAAKALTKKK